MIGRLRHLAKTYRIETLLVAAGLLILLSFYVLQRVTLAAPGVSDHTSEASVPVLGVPLDDVYIHCRYAENLREGSGYGFSTHQLLTADTSPLWVVLLALGGLLLQRLEVVAVLLSAIAYLVLAAGVYRVARDLFALPERFARIAGIATLVAGRLAWSGMSGMETSLAALVMLLAVEEHIRSRIRGVLRVREALWLGLGVLVRPEFLFVAVVAGIDWTVERQRADVREWPVVLLSLVSFAAPAVLLPFIVEQRWAFHSSLVQGAHFSAWPDASYLLFAGKVLGSTNVVLTLLTIAGLLTLLRSWRSRYLAIIAFGLPLLQAFVAPVVRHHGRYLFPVLPLMILLAVLAWHELEQRSAQMHRLRVVVMIAILIAGLVETGRWAGIAAHSVRNINDQHLEAVHYLRAHGAPHEVIAADDVGALGYLLGAPLLDLTGLVSPEIWKQQSDQQAVWRTARAAGATRFVIYRRLNPSFYATYKDSLELERDLPVRLPLTASADTVLSIYRLRTANIASSTSEGGHAW